MPILSTPLSELRSDYGVVVIGSGYGGGIAAYRMALRAQALANGNGNPAFSVCVLERGLERQAGEFPSSFADGVREIQADTRFGHVGSRTGLFDFRVNRDVSVLVGCGLGGGSLINAGVMLEPKPDVLDEFPEPVRANMARHFDEVRRALGVSECPTDITLDKVNGLSAAAAKLNMRVTPAPVAISFKTRINQFNVQQKECTLCGSCISGCNHSAKNTIAMNYLPGAANAGAAIFCGVETRAIAKGPDGSWLVHVRLNENVMRPFGSRDMMIRAAMVFLGAGTLGSTEILLRSRDDYGLTTSEALGHGFSGNGDVIAFGYNTRDRVNGFGYGHNLPPDAAVGPTIAATIDERDTMEGRGPTIQEGAIPGALCLPLRLGAPIMARATHLLADGSFDVRFRHLWREVDSMLRGPRHGALARTQTFLAMARDDGDGTLTLERGRVRVSWRNAGYREMHRAIANRLQQLTTAMKGRYVINPFWSRLFGRRLMTVHPLGGCRIGENPADAVVDPFGRVFTGEGRDIHEGLYVCDGAVIPAALGTNPSLTISAVAEHITQTAALSAGWQNLPAARPRAERVDPSTPGIKYAERLRGRVWLGDRPTRVELVLRISSENVADLVDKPEHAARVIGSVRMPDLKPDDRHWTVTEGSMHVLIDDPLRVDTKLLVYRLKLTNRAGCTLWLRGHKTVNLHTLRRHPWLTLTRVPFVLLSEAPREQANEVDANTCALVEQSARSADAVAFIREAQRQGIPVEGLGAARGSVADSIRMPVGIRITHEPHVLKRLRYAWRYIWFFTDTVIQSRVWAVRRTRAVNPFDVPLNVLHRNHNLGLQIKDKTRPHSPRFHLTRYKSRRRKSLGPVMLAPGFGMSTFAFYAARNGSFAEFLHRRGYDVWLFDYRASDDLAASLEQFDIDDLAKHDFPDAIDAVYDASGKRRVRVVAHCLSSLTMQMSLLSKSMDTNKLHSVVLSQSFAFIDLPWITRVKVRLRLPQLLTFLNFRPVVTTDFDLRASFPVRLLDRLLYFFPSKERCHEGVCRRLLLFYGEVVQHDQIDVRTHDTFYHLFDRGNLTSFKHIGRMFVRGRISDRRGKDVYLTRANGPNVTVPITLLSGEANGMFLPSGARKTHDWLVAHGPFGDLNREVFTLVRTPDHGHLDSFIGKNAKREVFPKIADAMVEMDRTLARYPRLFPR